MLNLGRLDKFLPLAICGVHAAASVPGVSDADRRLVVLNEIVAFADKIAGASSNPEVEAVGLIVDLVASIINALVKKQQEQQEQQAAAPATK